MAIVNKMLLVLLLAVLPECLVVTAQTVQDAQQAVNKQDYQTALRIFRLLAEKGDAEGQYDLGLMYLDGLGVPKNDAEAVNWFRKAANQGYTAAQANLGAMYQSGLGIPTNDVEAVNWFRKAADGGYAAAQYNLGTMYRDGRGAGVPVPNFSVTKRFSALMLTGASIAPRRHLSSHGAAHTRPQTDANGFGDLAVR
jgi:hypothetical protein